MEFLKKLLSSDLDKKKEKLPWITLFSEEQLQLITEQSKTNIQIIFKFSSRCGINRIMLNRFEKVYEMSQKNADLYFLDIIEYRNVSNLITHKFKIKHESPQVLVFKNGVVVNHASHSAISDLDINSYG